MTVEHTGDEALIRGDAITVKAGDRLILDAVDIRVDPGRIVTLIGPNGSGKTTLVRTLLGLLRPGSGTVRRRRGLTIGYVPQHVHVERTLPLTVRRFVQLGGRVSHERVEALLAEVGAPHIVDSSFHDISGGEMRRAMLARALLHKPDLLVMDEPTANVDIGGQAEFYEMIRRIRDQHACGILLVSHDLHLVMGATDEVLCLNRHVCCRGHPESVSRHPEYLALFGSTLADNLALYQHHHDHVHAPSGDALSPHGDANTNTNTNAHACGAGHKSQR